MKWPKKINEEKEKHAAKGSQNSTFLPDTQLSGAVDDSEYEQQYQAELDQALALSTEQVGTGEAVDPDSSSGVIEDVDEDEEWLGLNEALEESKNMDNQQAEEQPGKKQQNKQNKPQKQQGIIKSHQPNKTKKNRGKKKKNTRQHNNPTTATTSASTEAGEGGREGGGDEIDEDLVLALKLSMSQFEEAEDELVRTAIDESLKQVVTMQKQKEKSWGPWPSFMYADGIPQQQSGEASSASASASSASSSSSQSSKKKSRALVTEDNE